MLKVGKYINRTHYKQIYIKKRKKEEERRRRESSKLRIFILASFSSVLLKFYAQFFPLSIVFFLLLPTMTIGTFLQWLVTTDNVQDHVTVLPQATSGGGFVQLGCLTTSIDDWAWYRFVRLGSHWIKDLGHGLDGFVQLKKSFLPKLGKSFNPLLANLIHAHIIYLIIM